MNYATMLHRALLVGFGGFIGADARFFMSDWVAQRWGSAFPYGTFVINVSGSFILAVYVTLALRFGWSDSWRLLVAVGFVGAYTTFSTFEFESIQLVITGGGWRVAAINLVGSVVAGFIAVYVGVVVAGLLGHGRD